MATRFVTCRISQTGVPVEVILQDAQTGEILEHLTTNEPFVKEFVWEMSLDAADKVMEVTAFMICEDYNGKRI